MSTSRGGRNPISFRRPVSESSVTEARDPHQSTGPDVLERCLQAGQRMVSELVTGLPPRSQSPLRDLTLEQIDGLLQIPDEGQPEVDFICERGLQPGGGQLLVRSLLRRRLLTRTRVDGVPRVQLSERGRKTKEQLVGLRRGLFARIMERLRPEQTSWLAGLLSRITGPVTEHPDPADERGPEQDSAEGLLESMLQLRRGLADLLGVSGRGEDVLSDVTLHQQEALLRMPTEGLTMREFARALGIAHGSATALADRMVARGLVERETDPSDRRIVRLRVTEVARARVDRLRARQRESVEKLLAGLDEQHLVALGEVADRLRSDQMSQE